MPRGDAAGDRATHPGADGRGERGEILRAGEHAATVDGWRSTVHGWRLRVDQRRFTVDGWRCARARARARVLRPSRPGRGHAVPIDAPPQGPTERPHRFQRPFPLRSALLLGSAAERKTDGCTRVTTLEVKRPLGRGYSNPPEQTAQARFKNPRPASCVLCTDNNASNGAGRIILRPRGSTRLWSRIPPGSPPEIRPHRPRQGRKRRTCH